MLALRRFYDTRFLCLGTPLFLRDASPTVRNFMHALRVTLTTCDDSIIMLPSNVKDYADERLTVSVYSLLQAQTVTSASRLAVCICCGLFAAYKQNEF